MNTIERVMTPNTVNRMMMTTMRRLLIEVVVPKLNVAKFVILVMMQNFTRCFHHTNTHTLSLNLLVSYVSVNRVLGRRSKSWPRGKRHDRSSQEEHLLVCVVTGDHK